MSTVSLAINSWRNVRDMTQYTKQQMDAFRIWRKWLILPRIWAQNGGE